MSRGQTKAESELELKAKACCGSMGGGGGTFLNCRVGSGLVI